MTSCHATGASVADADVFDCGSTFGVCQRSRCPIPTDEKARMTTAFMQLSGARSGLAVLIDRSIIHGLRASALDPRRRCRQCSRSTTPLEIRASAMHLTARTAVRLPSAGYCFGKSPHPPGRMRGPRSCRFKRAAGAIAQRRGFAAMAAVVPGGLRHVRLAACQGLVADRVAPPAALPIR